MTSPAFDDLCTEICELAGIEARPAPRRERGGSSLHLRVGDVHTTLLHLPEQLPNSVCVLAELGQPPSDRELPALLAMLNANFHLGDGWPAAIGCAPSGEAILQMTCPLQAGGSPDLHARLLRMADFAHGWRANFMLDEDGQPDAWAADLRH